MPIYVTNDDWAANIEKTPRWVTFIEMFRATQDRCACVCENTLLALRYLEQDTVKNELSKTEDFS